MLFKTDLDKDEFFTTLKEASCLEGLSGSAIIAQCIFPHKIAYV